MRFIEYLNPLRPVSSTSSFVKAFLPAVWLTNLFAVICVAPLWWMLFSCAVMVGAYSICKFFRLNMRIALFVVFARLAVFAAIYMVIQHVIIGLVSDVQGYVIAVALILFFSLACTMAEVIGQFIDANLSRPYQIASAVFILAVYVGLWFVWQRFGSELLGVLL